MNHLINHFLLSVVMAMFTSAVCQAQQPTAKRRATNGKTKTSAAKPVAKNETTSAAKVQRALASVGSTNALGRGGVPNDPTKAVEIRGQSRTLSMMLVLKNGKENINFIKIRKDYQPEIAGTQY